MFHRDILQIETACRRKQSSQDLEHLCLIKIQSNMYKTTTLGTIKKRSSWTGGRLINHKPNLVVLGRFLISIPTVNVL